MKYPFLFFLILTSFTIPLQAEFISTPTPEPKIKVLIITGGHGYKRKPFYEVFNKIASISYDTIVQPKANEVIASPGINQYDVLVFYDLYDSILPIQQQAYIDLLKKGKAMIFLHHSLVSYQHWPEFIKIVGGQYHTHPVVVDGDTLNADYEHGVSMSINVVDKKHSVIQGIQDFEIVDETYCDVEILPGVKPLLRTTHPKSMHYVAWINHYGSSEVLYIQLGHGPSAYANPNYQKLLQQAIEWSAARHSP